MTDLAAIKDELRTLLAAATPGPWRTSGTKENPHWYVSSPIALVHGPAMERADHVQETIDRWIADARLIAAMRNALPLLLADTPVPRCDFDCDACRATDDTEGAG